MGTVNDRAPNWRNENGYLYLQRCYHCDPYQGMENYVLNVPLGICTWCGWSDPCDPDREEVR